MSHYLVGSPVGCFYYDNDISLETHLNLTPIIVAYVLAIVAMLAFGTYLATNVAIWRKRRRYADLDVARSQELANHHDTISFADAQKWHWDFHEYLDQDVARTLMEDQILAINGSSDLKSTYAARVAAIMKTPR
jgi:hypothetical protein